MKKKKYEVVEVQAERTEFLLETAFCEAVSQYIKMLEIKEREERGD